MLNMSDLAGLSLANPAVALAAIDHDRDYGTERRTAAPLDQLRLSQMLDEVDYGMLLLSDETRVVHVNKAARRELDAQHPLQLLGTQLRTRHTHDVLTLSSALAGAAHRGLRRLLRLGDDSQRVSVAVVPLPALESGRLQVAAGWHPPPEGAGKPRNGVAFAHPPVHAVMLVLGKRRMCEELTIDWYARSHGLTAAETVVIKGLCADLTPHQIAARQGVGLATIRTQIGGIRIKTGAGSIKALVRQVAMLPPLVSALQGLNAVAAPPRAPAPRSVQLSQPMVLPGTGPQRRAVPA